MGATLVWTAATAVAATGPAVTATVPVGTWPEAVAVDPVDHTAYVVNSQDNTVAVIDESAGVDYGKLMATLPVLEWPSSVAVDPSTHDVFVGSLIDDALSIIKEPGDGRPATVTTSTVDFGTAAMTFDPTGQYLYAAGGDESLAVVDESGDLDNGEVVATIPIGFQTPTVAVDSSNHNVYVLSDGQVSVVDESGDRRHGQVTDVLPVDPDAAGLAVDPSNHNVYVTSMTNDSIGVIDEAGGAGDGRMTSIPVGRPTEQVAVDPSTHDVYLTSSDVVEVVDESGDARNGTVVSTLRTGPGGDYVYLGADAVAVDPSDGEVTVTNTQDDTVSLISPDVDDEVAPGITGTPPPASAGRPYSYQFPVIGSPAPYDTITAGALPPGLTLSTYGRLSGTPTNGGTYAFTVTAANSQGPVVSHSVTLEVDLAPPTDLALSVTGPASAAGWTDITEEVTVTNRGPATAYDVTTTLETPPGLTQSGSVSEPGSDDPLWWFTAILPAHRSITYDAPISVNGGYDDKEFIGGFVATFASDDPDLANNAAITAIQLTP